MKKFLLFAITALLMGGFISNAEAQVVKRSAAKERKAVVKVDRNADREAVKASRIVKEKGENWNDVLKRYDLAVDKCLKLYKAQNEKGATAKPTEDFEKSLKVAQDLKTKIEKSKKELNRSQVRRFDMITRKFNQIFTKD